MTEIPTPLEQALAGAADTARATARTAPGERAVRLRAAADALDAAAGELVPIAMAETRLPEARLTGELARTTFQARLFADRLEAGLLHDVRIDHADPDWPMGARPDVRRTQVPIGPVLVFAASNFPFAFSVFGGDTVSALAAGCPVVVKAHPGHPELSRRTAELVAAAFPEGVFALIEGEQAGADAVQDPRIRAVGFTGSTRGGRALFDLAARRPDPIPFYGELGSTNPVVVTPAAWAERAGEIATGFAGSMVLGSGQFCTKPGVVLVPDADAFLDAVPELSAGPMLNERISSAYRTAAEEMAGAAEVVRGDLGSGGPVLFRTDADAVLARPELLGQEVFGPAALVVGYAGIDQALAVLDVVGGQLTGTVQGAADDPDAGEVIARLAEHAGRVIWNGWPTGVTVSDAQHHGGPYPSSTAPLHTSVGTAAAERFLRPVAFQSVPDALLPAELRDGAEGPRRLDGAPTV
ncbi:MULTISPECIES: aldehyde dehydrogenase (NADP(+)) [Pseudonocardia]|uniref:NADP-dependent fatty aldehyde dehydrogenase n=2 Tax=Pseudonocardia TaxID=1847 RepID=A0A1Y2MLT3_PSEAH|nr:MULTISPECIES: aldehyde dehydrogenase (NADP(+)) [Pseudonocardia]OSY36245.1 NADP-dependent fatty aldehyde dehydrogenase [Pseudonocardia autotrophica]TDN73053.1 NADP-dependent aldehyde dehydrogenase [Pseudonocardia autotrophica]BBG03771.1 aldehyde dehydrogenase [Pseudonocardia autotrophica]GEC26621.1 aldehyde dehydrogenase [Pseudonocardia saturnea]